MRFIKLSKSRNEGPVWVNPDRIQSMDGRGQVTRIVFADLGDDLDYIEVTESPEQIVEMLK